MQGQGQRRLIHLDGLRGVAALSVVAFHFITALAPAFVPAYQANAHWIAYTPVAVLWNGPFAVSVFFVLSGFVVANATIRRGDPLWIDIVIRYLRIAVPATLSVLLAWALLSIYPNAAAELAAKTGSPWLAFTYQGTIPPVTDAAFNGAIGIFVFGGSFYNNVLWTMRPELIGSIVCFLVCCFPSPRARIFVTLVFGVAILFSRRYEYEGFVFGILLREAVAAGWRMRLPLLALVVGLAIGSLSGDALAAFQTAGVPAMFRVEDKGGLIYPIAALLVVYGTIGSRAAEAVLSNAVGRFLGAISFPIYLLHVPVICTIFASLCVGLYPDPLAVLALIAGTLAVLVGASLATELLIERPLLRRLGRLRRMLQRIKLPWPLNMPAAPARPTV